MKSFLNHCVVCIVKVSSKQRIRSFGTVLIYVYDKRMTLATGFQLLL